ncbi:MAG: metallophosphoesterase, partial [Deltaproteobacteria bacterium]|nr:metallophosphoesterase [Deltaproteobacteria bacterium]
MGQAEVFFLSSRLRDPARPITVARLAIFCVSALVIACGSDRSSSRSSRDQPRNHSAKSSSAAQPTPKSVEAQSSAPSCDDLAPLATRYPDAPRIVAMGDLHGDLQVTRAALRLGGAIDEKDEWIGGDLVVVQTGDILDRGDGEQAILDLFERLADRAGRAGGAVHVLNGNHELMNAAADFRYVTVGGFEDFDDVEGLDLTQAGFDRVPERARARLAAFKPGGPYALLLAGHNTVVVVGDTVFVHGGVSPAYADKGVIERLNREVRCWLVGGGPEPRALLHGQDSPVWSERYSTPPEDCAALDEVLAKLGAKRMVMGHEPQLSGITSACDGKAWRIDSGLPA